MTHPSPSLSPLRPVALTVDGRPDQPWAIGSRRPTLAWRLEWQAETDAASAGQAALQVVRARSRDDLDAGRYDHDSGRVSSRRQSLTLEDDLAAGQSVWWAVRVWDERGDPSPWSRASFFRVGVAPGAGHGGDDPGVLARWIEDPEYAYQRDGRVQPLPVFARRFDAEADLASAVLSITGLGQYTATLNGRPISDAVLEPGQTSYWAEIAYRAWDVTALVRTGENLIGIESGSGVYQQADTTPIGRYNFQPEHKQVMGTPKVLAHIDLTYRDGRTARIATDGSWLARGGATTFSSWWGGEDGDGRVMRTDWTASPECLEHPAWHPATVAELDAETIPRADTPLVADPRPPVTVIEHAAPVAVTAHDPDPATTTVTASAGAGASVVQLASLSGIFVGDRFEHAGLTHRITAVGEPSEGASALDASGIRIDPPLASELTAGTSFVSIPRPAYILDLGRNLVGLPVVTGSHPAGTTITLLGSEQPTPPTDLSSVSEAGIYRYTFGGTEDERWRARFTYNGQRYLVVRGLEEPPAPGTVTLDVIRAANEPTATFETSDPMLQSIYDITLRALEGNMMSVLTDCPNREKGPYTGDNLHNIDTELTLFDMRAYQRQLVANMRTSQRPHPIGEARQPGRYAGLIANIAPEFHPVPDGLYGGRWFLDDPHWGGAIIRIPWQLYVVYGDDATLRPNYAAMKRWLDYVGRSKDDNASGEIHGLGDWLAGHDTEPAEAIIDIGYYEGARTLARIAAHLGETADADVYRALADRLAAEYNERYLHVDEATGRAWYANDTQASNAIALDAGLVPPAHRAAVTASLVDAVAGFGHRLSHGSVGGGPVFRMLHAAGRDDLILRMVTSPEAPSYAYQVQRGQTTLAEDLSGGQSQNHHFLGQVAAWLVHDLVGIAQHPGSIGYEHLRLHPASGGAIDAIDRLEASYTTPRGTARARVLRGDGTLTLDVTVPPGTDAEVWVPVPAADTDTDTDADAVRGARDVQAPPAAERMGDEPGHAVFRVRAGRHVFTSPLG